MTHKKPPRHADKCRHMVAAYRAGASLREVAKDFNETKSTIQRWVAHAQGKRLDRVDFYDKPSGSKQPKNKSSTKLEKRVLQLRKYLKDKSILGLHGADAILEEMLQRGDQVVPTSRTITNILKRNGMIDSRTRIRRPAPPPGWYLQDLQKQKVELDTLDRLVQQEKILLAPRRRAFPKRWKREEDNPLTGTIIYLRRTDETGRIKLLGRDFLVSKDWLHRLYVQKSI